MKFEFSPFVAVEIKDYEGACEYYESVLGMTPEKKHPVESHFISNGENNSMNFFVAESKNGKNDIYFEFKTDNAAEAKKLFEDKGCKILNIYSGKSFLVEDPFGLKYHVYQD